jgi:hypothetical protein
METGLNDPRVGPGRGESGFAFGEALTDLDEVARGALGKAPTS